MAVTCMTSPRTTKRSRPAQLASQSSARRTDRSRGSPLPRAAFDKRACRHQFRLRYDKPRAAERLPHPRREVRIQPDRSGTVRVVGAILHIQKALRRRTLGQHHIALRQLNVPAARCDDGTRPDPPPWRSPCRLQTRHRRHRDAHDVAARHPRVTLTLRIDACVVSVVRCAPRLDRISAARRAWSAGSRGTLRRAWNCAAPPDKRRTPRPSAPSARAARAPGR